MHDYLPVSKAGSGTKIREFPNHGRVVDNVVSDTGANLPLPRRAGGGL